MQTVHSFFVPAFLAELVAHFVAESRIKPDQLQRGIRLLRNMHRQVTYRSVHVPYDDLAVPFLYKYFGSNFASTTLALRYFGVASQVSAHTTICDIGCGSGSSTAAFLLYLDGTVKVETRVNVIMYDRSLAQCNYARRVLEALVPVCKHLQIQSTVVMHDLRTAVPSVFDDTIGSFWLLGAFVFNELGLSVGRRLIRAATDIISGPGSNTGLLIVEDRISLLQRLMECETDVARAEPLLSNTEYVVRGLERLRRSSDVESPKTKVTSHGILFRRHVEAPLRLQTSLGV